MSSRDRILGALRATPTPFQGLPAAPAAYQPMVPDTEPTLLRDRFIREAEALACVAHQARDDAEAHRIIIESLAGDGAVSAWAFDQIPLPGLEAAFQAAGVRVSAPDDAHVRAGVTGVTAALAATGSLVLPSGTGRYRTPSLLPEVHIAVVRTAQILPTLEAWVAAQRAAGLDQMLASSKIIIISGPSRTADIAMELVMGVHGPRTVHIVLLD